VRLFRVHPIAFLSADAYWRYCRIGTTDAPFFNRMLAPRPLLKVYTRYFGSL
jgi:hypothetical protein